MSERLKCGGLISTDDSRWPLHQMKFNDESQQTVTQGVMELVIHERGTGVGSNALTQDQDQLLLTL